MKTTFLRRRLLLLMALLAIAFIFNSCRKDLLVQSPDNLKNALSIAEAKSYFETQVKNKISKGTGKSLFSVKGTETNLWQDVLTGITPVWGVAKFKGLHNGSNAVVTPIYKKGVYVRISEKKMVKFGFLNYLMMYKDTSENIVTEWIELKPTERWIDARVSRSYEGKIVVRNWNGSVKRVYNYSNGIQLMPTVGEKNTKTGTTTMNDGDGDGNGGNNVDPLVCYVTTNVTISVAAKLCPCEAHTFAQYAECRCGTKPEQGYNTTIEVTTEYDCSQGIPDDPPVGGGTGGGNTGGGEYSGGGDPNTGGGGASPTDYPPENCTEYETPTEPLPEGAEYAVACSDTSIPAEEPAEEPTNPYEGLDISSEVLALAQRLYLSYQEALFLESHQDIFTAISGYLAQHPLSEDAGVFAKWAVGYLMLNTGFDYHIFFDANEFSGINNLPAVPPTEIAIDMTGVTDIPSNAPIGIPRLLASTPSRNNTEDLQYGTNGNTSGILSLQIGKNDNLLFSDMTDLFELTSTGDLQDVAYQFIDRFRNNIGGIYENQSLNNEVRKSATYSNFITRFKRDLQTKINNAGGVLDNTSMNLTYRPIFNGMRNKINGLQILINDTEQTQIKLLNFQINPTTQEWIADVEVTITDHFGLDKHDALTYQGEHRGFAAWWLLQNTRNYKPFITRVFVRNRLFGGL